MQAGFEGDTYLAGELYFGTFPKVGEVVLLVAPDLFADYNMMPEPGSLTPMLCITSSSSRI